MEFTITFRCNGSSFADRFGTIKLIHCPPLFLEHLKCESFQEYLNGVVDADFVTPMDETHKVLLQDGVSSNSGTILFRHTKSNHTARLSYVCQEVLLDRPTLEILVICRYYSIRWSDITWDILGILSCNIRLSLVVWRSVVIDHAPYVAVHLQDLPVSSLTSELRSRCVAGKNISYDTGVGKKTARSLLIPRAMVNVDTITHDGLWLIVLNDRVHSLSKECARALHIPQDCIGTTLDDLLHKYHTLADYRMVKGMFHQLDISDDNEKVCVEVDFILEQKVRTQICGYRVNRDLRAFVFTLIENSNY